MPGGSEAAQAAISGRTRTRRAAIWGWPSSPCRSPSCRRFHCCQRWPRWSRTASSWSLVQRLGTTHSDAPSCGRSRASTAAGSAAAMTRTACLVQTGMEQGSRGGRAGISQVAEVIGELNVAAALGCGQPPGGGGHGGVAHRACAAGAGTGASCRSTRSCSADQVPVTAAQSSTRPSFSKRPVTASKSAPAARTAPCHTGLTRRSRPPGSAIHSAGSNQSPRSFRTSRPVAATRSPSCTTSPETSTWPGNHAEPDTGTGVQNAPFGATRLRPHRRTATTQAAQRALYRIVPLLAATLSIGINCLSPRAAAGRAEALDRDSG